MAPSQKLSHSHPDLKPQRASWVLSPASFPRAVMKAYKSCVYDIFRGVFPDLFCGTTIDQAVLPRVQLLGPCSPQHVLLGPDRLCGGTQPTQKLCTPPSGDYSTTTHLELNTCKPILLVYHPESRIPSSVRC